jgi:hypothetical protein
MVHFRATATVILALAIATVTVHSGLAASAKCNAELRMCNSHCRLVYESKRSNRVCRDRCKDEFYLCKVQPS